MRLGGLCNILAYSCGMDSEPPGIRATTHSITREKRKTPLQGCSKRRQQQQLTIHACVELFTTSNRWFRQQLCRQALQLWLACGLHAANQPIINQSINQSINQPTNPSIHPSINQSIHQSINQSINRTNKQSINQSTNTSSN